MTQRLVCKEWAEAFFGSILTDISDLRNVPVTASQLWDGLLRSIADESLCEEDLACARETYRGMGLAGCATWVHKEKSRRNNSIFIVDSDGKKQRLANQAIRGTKKRRRDGTVERQQLLWVSFSYDETMAFFDSLFSVAYGASARVAAFTPVRDAYMRFPEAPSAGEACRLNGIDPTCIEIADNDVRGILGA